MTFSIHIHLLNVWRTFSQLGQVCRTSNMSDMQHGRRAQGQHLHQGRKVSH